MKFWASTALVAICVVPFACGGGNEEVKTITLQGAGASFPYPIYDAWFKAYNEQDPSIRINYTKTGSGAGIRSFLNEEVDFGASDAAMKDEEIAKVKRGAVLLPMTAGSIVLAFNLEGVDELKLSREAYAGIFLDKIKKWNDPKIATTNEGVELPDLEISIIRRADSSGTTYVFTKHLSAISEEWAQGPGTGKTVQWLGNNYGGKKNDGVAALLTQTPGSIGYVEYGFAHNSKLPMVQLENKAGKFITPSLESASASLGAVALPENLIAWISDPEGEGSYPIVTYTWMLLYKKYPDADKAAALKKVLTWCLNEGQKRSAKLHYIPLPANVVERVQKALDTVGS